MITMNFQELLMKITVEKKLDYYYDAAGNRTLKKNFAMTMEILM